MELWTKEHLVTLLPSIAVMLILGIVLRRLLVQKDYRVRLIPLQVIACLLLLLELGKQILSLSRGYDLYHLPFHFCSLFVFALPVMAFYRGKHRQTANEVVCALCAALFLLMLIYPNLIYGAGDIRSFFTDYLSLHTVAFHNLVMLALVLIIALRLHTPGPRHAIRPVIAATAAFCLTAATMAQLLQTNYANFYSCNIPVLQDLRMSIETSLGYTATQILYVAIVATLHILFVFLSYQFYRGLYAMIWPATAKSRQEAG